MRPGDRVRLNGRAGRIEPRLVGMTGTVLRSDPEGMEVDVRLDGHPDWMDNYEDGETGVLTFAADAMEVC